MGGGNKEKLKEEKEGVAGEGTSVWGVGERKDE